MKRIVCLIIGHKWYYTGRASNWVHGGFYFYECERCAKTKSEIHYQGGY